MLMNIVIIGSKEMCLGFKLAGVKETHSNDNIEDMNSFVEKLFSRSDVGIVVMDTSSFSKINWALKKKIEVTAKPSFITVQDFGCEVCSSEEDLNVLIKRALGFDLKK
jgi:vacuolar-type H+-ATPase subunit F/Vma7